MSTISNDDTRVAEAEAILADVGLSSATVRVAGHESEVALISATRSGWEALLEPEASETVRRVKQVGFRYVAIDLDIRPEGG